MSRPHCENIDPNVFFPEDDLYTREATADARALCSCCSVKDWCRENYSAEPYGIFFGTTPEQRGFDANSDE